MCICRFYTGTTVRENCDTEPQTDTNVTNSLAISVTNSTMDTNRLRNAISGLLMSEMAQANGNPSFGPSVSWTTPPSSYYPQQSSQQPIIVVQPPAQQIYFNGAYDGTLSRPIRSPNPGSEWHLFEFIFKFESILNIFFLRCRLFPQL